MSAAFPGFALTGRNRLSTLGTSVAARRAVTRYDANTRSRDLWIDNVSVQVALASRLGRIV